MASSFPAEFLDTLGIKGRNLAKLKKVSLDNPSSFKQKRQKSNKANKLPVITYESVVPLNNLFNQYIINQDVLHADYHGSLLTVIKSKNQTLVGKVGICVQETKETFVLVTKQKMITCLKAGSVFGFYRESSSKNNNLGELVCLYGNNLRIRPHDRVSKKFKSAFKSLDL